MADVVARPIPRSHVQVLRAMWRLMQSLDLDEIARWNGWHGPLMPSELLMPPVQLWFTNGILFVIGIPTLAFLSAVLVIASSPTLILSSAGGVRFLRQGFELPTFEDDSHIGYFWSILLPVTGGILGVAWVGINLLLPPSVLFILLVTSPATLIALIFRLLTLQRLTKEALWVIYFPSLIFFWFVFHDIPEVLPPAAPLS